MFVRQFSSGTRRSGIMDILKFYKKSAPEVPTKSTEEVMAEATGSKDEGEPAAFSKQKIEILGRRHPSHVDAEAKLRKLNGFVVHRWIPRDTTYIKALNETSSKDYESVVGSTLDSLFAKAELTKLEPLTDLFKRFQLIKDVQKSFGIAIPDNMLAKFSSYSEIETYLVRELNPDKEFSKRSEFVPDAVDFNEADFDGTNVSIGDFVFESEKKKMYKKLTVKAKKIEEENTKSFVSSV